MQIVQTLCPNLHKFAFPGICIFPLRRRLLGSRSRILRLAVSQYPALCHKKPLPQSLQHLLLIAALKTDEHTMAFNVLRAFTLFLQVFRISLHQGTETGNGSHQHESTYILHAAAFLQRHIDYGSAFGDK